MVEVVLPSGLSMLWEPVAADEALKDRFGFSNLDEAWDWVQAALQGTWGITVQQRTRLVISDQNAIVCVGSDRGALIVKWSRDQQRFDHLDATTSMLRMLADRGVPVAAPVITPGGQHRVVLDAPAAALSVAVLPELSGDWLDVRDEAAVISAGQHLARLHQVLGDLEAPQPPPAQDEGLVQRITRWLREEDRGLALHASDRLQRLLAGAPRLAEEPQPVHNDYRAANIVTRESQVVGILDFDDVVVGHRVHDLAKASVYLGTRFTAWRPTAPEVRGALRAGYESVRPLSAAEGRWLEVLVLWHGLMAIPGEDDPGGWAAAV